MKVLWFTETPSLASKHLKFDSNGSGWISSLEKQIGIINEIQLCVVFHHGTKDKKHITIDKTEYYSLPRLKSKGRISRLIRRWRHEIESGDVVRDYVDIVEQIKPDLIHIFGTENPFGLIIDKVNIPTIIQIQGNLTVIEKKWHSGISMMDIFLYSYNERLIRAYGIWHDFFVLKKKVIREQKIFKICNFFIGRTDWDRRITEILSEDSKYFHCDEIMRDNFYHNQWIKPNNRRPIIISTMRYSTYKGLETILEAATILKGKKSQDFEWQIVGIKEDEEIVHIIEKSKKTKFLKQNISLLGSLDSEKLLNKLLQANYYVHASHIENSPNSVCEAMLLGMPVIATYAGGTASIVQNNKEGLLVQDGDPYALAGAILEFIKNEEHAIWLGLNARATALIRHNPERIGNTLMNIYKVAISEYANSNQLS